MSDVRLIELRILQMAAAGAFNGSSSYFTADAILNLVKPHDPAEIIATMLEDLHLRCESNSVIQHIALRLRGEYHIRPQNDREFPVREWENPREALIQRLRGQTIQLAITWRGLHRIETLRNDLATDRILEPFGILLDLRYYHQDLMTEIGRTDRASLAVFALDLDHFKAINDNHGHPAGDVVMKAYLSAVRDSVGTFGTAYRGRGDEVKVILPGVTKDRAVMLAEDIRGAVKRQRCTYKDKELPVVTTSIGVAATPPDERLPSLEDRADERQRAAKDQGRDIVIA